MSKGQAQETLIIKILAVVMLVIFVGYLYTFKTKAESKFDFEACRSSVLLNAQLKVKGMDVIEGLQVHCPTQDLTVTETKTIDKQRKLATSLINCRKIFDGQESALFSESGVYCHPCAVIRFADTSAKPFSLSDYLVSHRAPAPDGDKTFAEVLAGYKTPAQEEYLDASVADLQREYAAKYEQWQREYAAKYKQWKQMPEARNVADQFALTNEIDPQKTYFIVYWHAKGASTIQNVFQKIGLDKAVVGGGLAGGAVLGTLAFFFAPAVIAGTTTVLIATSLGILGGGAGVYELVPGSEQTQYATMTKIVDATDANVLVKMGCENLFAAQSSFTKV